MSIKLIYALQQHPRMPDIQFRAFGFGMPPHDFVTAWPPLWKTFGAMPCLYAMAIEAVSCVAGKW